MAVKNYSLVSSTEQLADLCETLARDGRAVGFDIETGYHGEPRAGFALHPETAFVVGISMTNDTSWAVYAPLGHDCGGNLANRAAARALWPLLNTGLGVAHNVVFELQHLARWFKKWLGDDPDYGDQVQASGGYFPVLACTQVEAYLAAEFQRFGLKFLTEAMFGHKMRELHELFGDNLTAKDRKTLRFNVLDFNDLEVRDYACEDSAWCLAIHERYYAELMRLRGSLFRTEMAIASEVIPGMQDYGVPYDWGLMRSTYEELVDFRDRFNAEIMADLSAMADRPIAVNLASPPKLSAILFDELGMRTSVYTKGSKGAEPGKRKMSTGKIALERLSREYPVVKKIVQWKEMAKLEGTYLKKYETSYKYADDGRTHPNHHAAFVVTGRFAVSDPPYQQSPKVYHYKLRAAEELENAHESVHGPKCRCGDTEYQPEPWSVFRFNFRDLIIAPEDHYILGFDLSQAELRAIAGEAKEQALLKAFASDQDVHSLTAALMLRIPIEQVGKDQRSLGKTMNFALLYGMGIKSLADRLALPIDEAMRLYDAYFQAYPGIKSWREQQVAQGKRNGYVMSRFGRKLPIWEYTSEIPWMYEKGDRACVNYPIQGAATGDYVKIAMVRAIRALKKHGLADRVHLMMNVHDALEFSVHRSLLPQQVIPVLHEAVIFPVSGWPSMRADWHLGRSWGSPQEITVKDGRFFIGTKNDLRELAPIVSEDEQSGEEVVNFNPDDIEAIHRVLAEETIEVAAQTVVVALGAMPSEDAYRAFLAYLVDRPGPNQLILRTPEGDLPVTLDPGTALSPGDIGQVSQLLGPVEITFSADSLDMADLIEGLEL
jgi:DNA polymerase I